MAEVTGSRPDLRSLELESQRLDALTAGDVDMLARLCHPDLLYTHSTGHTDTCQTYLNRCRSGFYRYETIDCEVQAQVLAGNTLAFTEVMSAQVQVGGEPRSLHTHALAVWTRVSGIWCFIAYHALGV